MISWYGLTCGTLSKSVSQYFQGTLKQQFPRSCILIDMKFVNPSYKFYFHTSSKNIVFNLLFLYLIIMTGNMSDKKMKRWKLLVFNPLMKEVEIRPAFLWCSLLNKMSEATTANLTDWYHASQQQNTLPMTNLPVSFSVLVGCSVGGGFTPEPMHSKRVKSVYQSSPEWILAALVFRSSWRPYAIWWLALFNMLGFIMSKIRKESNTYSEKNHGNYKKVCIMEE